MCIYLKVNLKFMYLKKDISVCEDLSYIQQVIRLLGTSKPPSFNVQALAKLPDIFVVSFFLNTKFCRCSSANSSND